MTLNWKTCFWNMHFCVNRWHWWKHSYFTRGGCYFNDVVLVPAGNTFSHLEARIHFMCACITFKNWVHAHFIEPSIMILEGNNIWVVGGLAHFPHIGKYLIFEIVIQIDWYFSNQLRKKNTLWWCRHAARVCLWQSHSRWRWRERERDDVNLSD